MIGLIENAILARLKAASGSVFGYSFPTLDSYPEDWDAMLKAKGRMDYPAAWVSFGGFTNAVESDAGCLVTASFGVVVAARNLRNETATRHGGKAGEPGSYQLMLDAIGVLQGWSPSAVLPDDQEGCGPLSFKGAQFTRPVEGKESLTISAIALRFDCDFHVAAAPAFGSAADALGNFARFHAAWDVMPLNGIIDLPDDAKADAVDHIELPV